MAKFVIGVDVGGTNTDAVCLDGNTVVEFSKVATTADVTSGVKHALWQLLAKLNQEGKQGSICRVNIGTTHFVNAVIQRQNLTPVAVVRLCGTATKSLKPFVDFPEDLKQTIFTLTYLINGGYQFDGQAITEVSEEEVLKCIQEIKAKHVKNVIISGVFSPVNMAQEEQVASLFRQHYPGVSLTLSHQVGQMGLLERENASILNESLKPLCARTISAFTSALQELNLHCPLFLTQNDGTVVSAEQTLDFPVHTFSSGPTNSMRGAAHLSGVKDAIVIDIGGTTSDVGCLMEGFPKQASTRVKVGGVTTNFRMPDVVSIGLGGGSKIMYHTGCDGEVSHISVGPDSVGFQLSTQSKIFGGDILTSSDIAVATKMAAIGDASLIKDLPPQLLSAAVNEIHRKIENLIDLVKLSEDDVPVILVGGGSILLDEKRKLKGASKVIKPPHFQVANAVGAALSQVGGLHDTVVALANISRDDALNDAKEQARKDAIEHGAEPDTIEITEVSEVPLAYLPGNASRIKIKAVGNLTVTDVTQEQTIPATTKLPGEKAQKHSDEAQNMPAKDSSQPQGVPQHPLLLLQETQPDIDPTTGEWSLSCWDVECISIGAGILGCGGGGSPYLGKLMVFQQLKEGKKIKIIAPERLNTTVELTGLVSDVYIMGAPGVIMEKIPSGMETTDAMYCMQDLFAAGFKEGSYEGKLGGVDIEKKDGGHFIENFPAQPERTPKAGDSAPKVVAVIPAEIGGSNAMEPFLVSANTGMPVVDCDGMGRAFPELQMYVPSIYGHPPCPSTLVDDKGCRCVALQADTPKDLEDYFRLICVKLGCAVGATSNPLTKDQLLHHSVLYSISRAWRLGTAVMRAQRAKTDPVDSIIEHENGKLLMKGKICDVTRICTGGFDKGAIRVDGTGVYAGQQLRVDFQNENLIAKMVKHFDAKLEGQVLASVPDLICITDVDSGQPITTEEIRFGLRVAVIVLACSPLLRTETALKVVGPSAFGYDDVEFKPIGEYRACNPVPPIPPKT